MVLARRMSISAQLTGPRGNLDRPSGTRPVARTAESQARPTRVIDSLHCDSTGTAMRSSRTYFETDRMLPRAVARKK